MVNAITGPRAKRSTQGGLLMVIGAVGALGAVGAVGIGCGGASGGTRSSLGGAAGASSGSGGQTGSGAGGAVTTGAGGAAATTALNCPGGVDPAAPLLTDFSSATWMNTQGKWATVAGDLTGSKYAAPSNAANPDGGSLSTMAGTVNITAANPSFELTGSINAGDYGFGLLSFDKCVNTTKYVGVQFTLGGTSAGCDILFELQTFDEQGVANKGGCDSTKTVDGAAVSCYKFPQIKVQVGAAPVQVLFTDLAGTGVPATADGMKAEIVGLQWQFQSGAPPDGGAQVGCSGIDLTIDDVRFIPAGN
jgi:hypothetical protein